MRDLLVEYKIIPNKDYEPIINPYHARKKGLTQSLNNNELASVLLQLAKRRGSSLETTGDDEGKVLSLLAKHDKALFAIYKLKSLNCLIKPCFATLTNFAIYKLKHLDIQERLCFANLQPAIYNVLK